MSTLVERIQEVIDAGYPQVELARAAGVTKGTSNQWISGGIKSIKFEYAQGIEALTGFSATWLVTGKGPKRVDELPGNLTGAVKIESLDDEDESPDAVRIRRVKLRLSAGIMGFAIDSVIEDDNPIFFRRNWLEQRGYSKDHLIAIRVKGESMEPGLYDGDTVIINTADTKLHDGDVYAVNYEGEAVIKRLVREIGFWWLVSDNQDQRRYARKRCEGEACIIIGKVIHKQSERI